MKKSLFGSKCGKYATGQGWLAATNLTFELGFSVKREY
jgi:hypothetical protein